MVYRYIYKITCTSGTFKDKFYFGQHTTENLNDGYKGSGTLLKKYYKKYPNDYIKSIICFCKSQQQLDEREKECIAKYINHQDCLNIAAGGLGQHFQSEETKRKISKAVKLRYSDPIERQKQSERLIGKNKGRKHSEEQNKKLSQLLKGRKHSEEHKRKISESLKGRPGTMNGKHLSDETKNKISQKLKGRKSPMTGRVPWNKGLKISKEQKEKISEAQKGKKLSEETKKKQSESMKKYWSQKIKMTK